MFGAFQHTVEDTPLFCRQCRGVFVHSLKTRQLIRAGSPAFPGEPILAICHHCRHPHIYFAREFSDFSPPHPEGSVFKIAGKSRLQPRDWVYIPGQPCVGSVKSRFRKGHEETFIIAQEDGSEIPWTSSVRQDYSPDDALVFYRLIPPYLEGTRIGERVYHIHRRQFGTVVGFLYGKESKLVVRFENETLILIQLPPSQQIADNHSLLQHARELFRAHLGPEFQGIQLDAGLGVLFAGGTCSSLSVIRVMRQLSKTIAGCRGFLDVITVHPPVEVPDEALYEQLWRAVLQSSGSVFGVKITCRNGYAVVEGFCRLESTRTELTHQLENIPGLRSLELHLQLRTQDDPQERERAMAVAQALRRNSSLRSAQIRVSSIQGTIFLEGFVSSSLQKNAATLAAMWAGRHLKVENKLQILKSVNGEPFIRVA